MADMVTRGQLEEAGQDAATLAAFANGAVGEPNLNRAGEDVQNLATIRAQAREMAAGVARMQPYLTKEDMEADVSQTVPTTGRVMNGGGAGDYTWNGSEWLWADVQPASEASVGQVRSMTVENRRILVDGAQLLYTGRGHIYPVMTDQDRRVLLGYDATTGKIVGAGLMTSDTIPPEVDRRIADYNQAVYIGEGPIYPILLDQNRRVLLGYDETTGKLVGAIQSSSESQWPIARSINHLLFYGQSLSVGAVGTPVLSVSQPYSNITFSGGPRAAGGDFSAFKPLVEDALTAPDGGTNRGETPCSGAANTASLYAAQRRGVVPEDHVILSSSAGRGSYRIDQLEKGSAWYSSQMLPHIANAHGLNADYALHAVAWLQGENDAMASTQTPYSTYKAKLAKLQADIEADAQAISGQSSPVFVLSYQLSYEARAWADIALAQLHLCQQHPKFALATPMYIFPYAADAVHLTNVGYKWAGAYFGRAYYQLVHEQRKPDWLNPVSATATGTNVRIRFDVPTLPLVLDAVGMPSTTDRGFLVRDAGGQIAIESVAVNGQYVEISLARAPGASAVVRYALDYAGTGLPIGRGASGNLRDSTADSVVIDSVTRTLFHICPHFELPIIALGGI